jgi:hypothetical protein
MIKHKICMSHLVRNNLCLLLVGVLLAVAVSCAGAAAAAAPAAGGATAPGATAGAAVGVLEEARLVLSNVSIVRKWCTVLKQLSNKGRWWFVVV